ncbi:hypothetical protein HNY73_001615 [Argiope bruennichi]|uniref:Uncharacterized protein n=1 Tax=Argiope bruennichi TaxID=94029 RepID=A0A8T0FQW3_ARGBR|nr:hypothetical protein HNY73_001615 [Argiope bruennichi]
MDKLFSFITGLLVCLFASLQAYHLQKWNDDTPNGASYLQSTWAMDAALFRSKVPIPPAADIKESAGWTYSYPLNNVLSTAVRERHADQNSA